MSSAQRSRRHVRAADVARGLPAALTLAADEEALGQALATALGARTLRIYWSSDLIGVQLEAFQWANAITRTVQPKAAGAA